MKSTQGARGMTKARSSGPARTVSSREQPTCSEGVVQQRQPLQSDVFPVAVGEEDELEVFEDEEDYDEEGEGEEEAGDEEEEEEEDEEAVEEGAEKEEEAEEEEERQDEKGGEEDPIEEKGCWQREFLESRPIRVDFKLFFWAVYITAGLAYLHVKTSGSEQEAATQTPTTTTTTTTTKTMKTTKGGKMQHRKDVISPQTIAESSGGLERGSGTKKVSKLKKMMSGPSKGKAGEEGLLVPQGFVLTERAKDLTKTWEELKSLKEKKLSYESYLPMSCLKRPPLVNGKRPLEVRELDEDHVQSIMDSMLKHPTGHHLPFVGLIDPGQASRKEQVDLATLKNGHYDIFVLGGNQSWEARERLSCINPDNDDYKYNVCYVYVGLTVDEARQVAHMHNLAAG
ncbi:hypothetical protein CBR_g28773 [Chara braunii]|uniref:Uncharacterized protein n=1 Tax=Chara braunii TaxID=69332 RepID=A0A388L9S2_CHABU|nr:hypothetical protein CBR_g28773 [Chara braunii]|eukprot:GBG79059.1 hypothetical protein CBR_g28773 [Chara braunii]